MWVRTLHVWNQSRKTKSHDLKSKFNFYSFHVSELQLRISKSKYVIGRILWTEFPLNLNRKTIPRGRNWKFGMVIVSETYRMMLATVSIRTNSIWSFHVYNVRYFKISKRRIYHVAQRKKYIFYFSLKMSKKFHFIHPY